MTDRPGPSDTVLTLCDRCGKYTVNLVHHYWRCPSPPRIVSWAAVRIAMETPMGDPTAKLVLVAIAYRAGTYGWAWPKVATICADTGLSERSVRRAISRLVDAGRLEVETRQGRSSVFHVVGSYPQSVEAPADPGHSDTHPGHSDTPPRSLVHPEHVKEPVKERGRARERLVSARHRLDRRLRRHPLTARTRAHLIVGLAFTVAALILIFVH